MDGMGTPSALASAGARRWARGLAPKGSRVVDELECVLSVLLAIGFAHLINAHNVAWAAFSGYMVMRGHVSDSLLRGALRVLGTAIGAGLALLAVPVIHQSWPLSALACAVVGGVTMHGALTGRRAYAWLFAGLTFEMILLDKLEHPGEDIVAFVTTRLLAGSALAGVFLYAAHGSTPVLIAGTIAGVLIGRHIENGSHTATYVGTQFTLAILVTLVPDSYADAGIAPALERLAGTLVGLALLEPVLIAWHLIAPLGRSGASPEPNSGAKAK